MNSLYNEFAGKKVFITGHTGFKGSWLTLMLERMGASVTGFSLLPEEAPAHFNLLKTGCTNYFDNILHYEKLETALRASGAEIIFHMAAQPLVRESYRAPVSTYETNIIGTLNMLQAARSCGAVKAVVCITSDKVYENVEQHYSYIETDRLGGYDIYSSSKACCEILVDSFRRSFLKLEEYGKSHQVLIASARAGNVIGGGDWGKDRLIPDLMKAAGKKNVCKIRNPKSIRPWQHVLDCLSGYLVLGAALLRGDQLVSGAWNFGPNNDDLMNVETLIEFAKKSWPSIQYEITDDKGGFHEAALLMLDTTKAAAGLQWRPRWNVYTAVNKTIQWYRDFYEHNKVISGVQIDEYFTGHD